MNIGGTHSEVDIPDTDGKDGDEHNHQSEVNPLACFANELEVLLLQQGLHLRRQDGFLPEVKDLYPLARFYRVASRLELECDQPTSVVETTRDVEDEHEHHEGQLKRVRVGRMAEWSRAGRKLLPFLPENLKQALLTWGTAHSGYRKFAATLSDLYCTNPDCTDFEKRGHGNLTQEFAYGVDSDRHMIYCATCKKRFSETKCTEFFGAKLNGDDIAHILEKTVEGKSIRDIADELDLNKDSVNNVILKAKEICEKYVSGDKANVSKDALGDMNLEKGQKGKLSDFITEVVIPELTEEEDEGEEDEPKADE